MNSQFNFTKGTLTNIVTDSIVSQNYLTLIRITHLNFIKIRVNLSLEFIVHLNLLIKIKILNLK